VTPTDTITPSIPEQIARIDFVRKERRWIVGDGAFIDACSLFKRTGVPIHDDGRWSESVRDLLWGGAMPYDQQPARPPLMRPWEVTSVVRIGADRAQVDAIVRNAPLCATTNRSSTGTGRPVGGDGARDRRLRLPVIVRRRAAIAVCCRGPAAVESLCLAVVLAYGFVGGSPWEEVPADFREDLTLKELLPRAQHVSVCNKVRLAQCAAFDFAETAEACRSTLGGHNNEADAVRHAYWMADVTARADSLWAKRWGDAHQDRPDNARGSGVLRRISSGALVATSPCP
jgi:hypothetical protein